MDEYRRKDLINTGKMRLISFILYVLFFGCSDKNRANQGLVVDSISTSLELDTIANNKKNNSEFLNLFKWIENDSIFIEVENGLFGLEFQKRDSLPYNYKPYFKEYITLSNPETSKLAPFGRIKLKGSESFLIVIHEDIHGLIYYGLVFCGSEDRLVEKIILAESYSDEGLNENSKSVIYINNEDFKIKKVVNTCLYDYEKPSEIECSDTVFFFRLEGNLKFEQLTK